MAAGQIILQDSGQTSSHLTAALVCLDSAWVALVESHPSQIEDLLQKTDELVLLLQHSRSTAAGPSRSPLARFLEACSTGTCSAEAGSPAWSRNPILVLSHRLLALNLLLRHTAQNLLLLDSSRQAKRALYPHAAYAPAEDASAHHVPTHRVPTHHAPVGGLTQWLR